MISVNNLSIHFTGTDLFSSVSFLVNNKDRIGLVGKNGSGKSTLLNIISGALIPQEGEVVIPANTSIGYLQQEMDTSSRKSIFDEALTAFDETLELEKKIANLNQEIAERTDYESKAYNQLIHQLTEANERFQIIGGQSMQGETEKVLAGLGFKRSDFQRPVSEFSSGWQMRIELAKILLKKPDVILLDEPTNHLDIESIQWLEEFLINYFGAIVTVSHDRAFLDNVCKRTVEIELGKIYDYKSSYSGYVAMREDRLARQISAYNNQQNQVKQIERFVERFRYKNTKSRQVQSKIKMLDKMDTIEIEDIDQSAIHFRFPPAPRSGKVVLEGEHLGKSYGDLEVLKDLNFAVIQKDSIAFVGKNGEGKTTLSRIIVGELECTGTLKFGHNVQIGYFAQNQGDYLDPDKTVFETIDDIAAGEIRKQVRSILGSFLFSGDTIDKKVKILSGGEKSRLSLAKLLLTPTNLLILDEPTNHLDMQSKDILKNALLQYDGTLIIVSHDRDFLQGLTNKVFEFRDQKIKEHLGDIYDFLEYRKLKSLQQLEKAKKNFKDGTAPISENKLNYEQRKQLDREIRKTSNLIKKSELRIEQLEKDIQEKDQILSNPDLQENIDYNDVSIEYSNLTSELEKEMLNWENLHIELDKFLG
ncbi:MAG: ABC transporter ATP-binding protein [Deltaproteobacteria bacterium]|nr:MAG: ABC transporter ATP-binding protein [Deltaproteobacteria bacterium]